MRAQNDLKRSLLEKRLKSLFLASLKGDEHSYSLFLNEVSLLIRNYLRKSIGKRHLEHDADDLTQEILVSIHKKRDLFDSSRDVLPWLYAIARYRLIDAIRKNSRDPVVEALPDDLEGQFLVDEEVMNARGENAGEHLLDGLTEVQKEILWLAKVEEVPLADVAKETMVSHSLVKVSIHRSLKVLREKLKR